MQRGKNAAEIYTGLSGQGGLHKGHLGWGLMTRGEGQGEGAVQAEAKCAEAWVAEHRSLWGPRRPPCSRVAEEGLGRLQEVRKDFF